MCVQPFMPGRRNLCTGVAVAAFAFSGPCVEAATIFVDINQENPSRDGSCWPEAFKYLADALAAAEPGDEIWVADGVYTPDQHDFKYVHADRRDATFLLDATKDGVRLFGGFQGLSHPDGGEIRRDQRDPALHKTILSGEIGDAESFEDNTRVIITVSHLHTGVRIDGFTITAGHGLAGAAMHVTSSVLHVSHCVFEKNIASDRGGAVLILGDEFTRIGIERCVFRNNTAGGASGHAVHADTKGSVVVKDCTFVLKEESERANVVFGAGGSMSLVECVFRVDSPERE